MRRGQRRADRTGESASTTRGNKTTMLLCCRSPSRRIRQGCKRRVGPATAGNITIAASVAGQRLHDMTRRARNCVVSLKPGQASSGRHREFVLTPRPVSEGGRWHAWPSVHVRSGSRAAMPSKSPLRRVHPRKRPCWRWAVTSALGQNPTSDANAKRNFR